MIDLLITSYKAQCSWVSRRILNERKRLDFIWTVDFILRKVNAGLVTPKQVQKKLEDVQDFLGKNEAFDIYKETYDNLEKRFENGYSNSDPIERIA
jgi:hypothetical protein